MDWPIISLAAAAFGVLVFLIGYRFGTTAAYLRGAEHGYNIAEKAFLDALDQHVKMTEKVIPLTPKDLNLTQDEKDYLNANVATLDKMISDLGPEDEVSKQSLVSQRDAIQSVLDQDAKEKEKANV